MASPRRQPSAGPPNRIARRPPAVRVCEWRRLAYEMAIRTPGDLRATTYESRPQSLSHHQIPLEVEDAPENHVANWLKQKCSQDHWGNQEEQRLRCRQLDLVEVGAVCDHYPTCSYEWSYYQQTKSERRPYGPRVLSVGLSVHRNGNSKLAMSHSLPSTIVVGLAATEMSGNRFWKRNLKHSPSAAA